ncbi:MAG: hypothetical protein IKZ98_03500 [Clostridia bacterium]|nr:hypothetical protein [Clostridia bacterium]
MAVRRMNTIQGYTLPQREGMFPVPGQQQAFSPYSSRQVQDWTRGLNSGSRNRSVVTETVRTLPVFSSDGIRWDVLLVTLALLLMLFFSVLLSDVQALNAGGQRIGQLSEGIASLEDNNALLQAELDVSLRNVALSAQVSTLTLPAGGVLTGSIP